MTAINVITVADLSVGNALRPRLRILTQQFILRDPYNI